MCVYVIKPLHITTRYILYIIGFAQKVVGMIQYVQLYKPGLQHDSLGGVRHLRLESRVMATNVTMTSVNVDAYLRRQNLPFCFIYSYQFLPVCIGHVVVLQYMQIYLYSSLKYSSSSSSSFSDGPCFRFTIQVLSIIYVFYKYPMLLVVIQNLLCQLMEECLFLVTQSPVIVCE